MLVAPIPGSESERLAALRDLEVLDTGPEAEFDALVHAASIVCGVPISLISLIDAERQWFKANVGLPGASETPRDLAFCAHCILDNEILEVVDASQDPRFADNPLVSGKPDIRFYAGAPIRLSNGHRVGTLCVIDRQPQSLNDQQKTVLRHLAQAAASALEGRRAMRHQKQAMLALHASQSNFRTLTENAPIGVFCTDAQGACTYTNPSWHDIYGLTLEQSLDQGWAQTLHPEDREGVFTAWQATAAAGCNFDRQFRIQHPQSGIRHVHVVANKVTDEMGGVIAFVGNVEDVTERLARSHALSEMNQRFCLATEGGGIGIWDWNVLTNELVWDDQMYALYGLAAIDKKASYELWATHVHPEDLPYAKNAIQQALNGERPFDAEFRVTWEDGSIHFIKSSARLTRDDDGKVVRMVGANWDITESRELASQLAEQHELLSVTLRSIGDAVITTDASERIIWLNPVAERMTGWLSSEAIGKPLMQVFHVIDQDTRLPVESPVANCLSNDRVAGLAHNSVLISRNSEEFGIEDSAAPIRSNSGDVLGAVLVFHDVSEQRRLSNEMSYRATHDSLTGLFNRAELEKQLSRVLKAAQEHHSQHALMYIDLDQFKLVNDACGHSAGDQLLQQISKILAEVVRSRDMLARLGGDEFAIILEHCSSEQASRVAEKICDRMEDFRFLHDGRRFRIGTSIGLVPIDNHWKDTAAILQAADTSCYAAKEAGRNRVHTWFDTDMAMRTRHGEMQWTNRIEQALDENRFILFAQRIVLVGASDGNHTHAEVLLRMIDSDGSLIQPGAFLPAAERFHLASRIDRWVLSHAVQWMQALPPEDRLEVLSVNLSGQSVGDRAFHRWAIELLSAAGKDICAKLCIEITETSAVTNLADANVFIEQLRQLDVRLALDDFGAGASSFGYLKTLSVHYLKIDGQFIRDLVTDPLDEAAVKCFVEVAKVMGIQTIAEFVDNADVFERLKTLGVDFAQGYLTHMPAPIGELSDISAERV